MGDDDKPLPDPIVYAVDTANVRDKSLTFKGMKVHRPKTSERVSYAVLRAGGTTSIEVKKFVKLVEWTQNPYKTTDLGRFEDAKRKNHAVKASFATRTHFMFGKDSELVIRLNDHDMESMKKEDAEKKIAKLKEDNKDLFQKLQQRDNKVLLNKKAPVLVLQSWTFGRGLLIKLYKNPENPLESDVVKLQTINSRRLGDPIIDVDNNNELEGVLIDDQPLAKSSMIYAAYNEDESSPHTEGYGYSEIESIAHVAETLNIFLNEDVKEISKSAWLASILLSIQTAGLSNAEATTKITNIVNAVAKAGKIVGVNEQVQTEQLKLDPDLEGLAAIVEKLETIIFKTLQVPQFLVQSEAAANRATAIQSATQFLNGVVADDQRWIEDVLEEQWYDPFLRENMTMIKGLEPTTDKKENPDLPFHVRRVYNQAKASEFVDLADSVVKLVEKGIWDIQKGNEVLGSEEVTPRVLKAQEEAKKEAEKFAQDKVKDDEEKKSIEERKTKAVETVAAASAKVSGDSNVTT